MVLTGEQQANINRYAVLVAVKVASENTQLFGSKATKKKPRKGTFQVLVRLIEMFFKYEYDYSNTYNNKSVNVGLTRIQDVFMFYVCLMTDIYHDAGTAKLFKWMSMDKRTAKRDSIEHVMNFITLSEVCDKSVLDELKVFAASSGDEVNNIRKITDLLFLKGKNEWRDGSLEAILVGELRGSMANNPHPGYAPLEDGIVNVAKLLREKKGGVIFDQSSKGAAGILADSEGVGVHISVSTLYDGGTTMPNYTPGGLYDFFRKFCSTYSSSWLKKILPNVDKQDIKIINYLQTDLCERYKYGLTGDYSRFELSQGLTFRKFRFDSSPAIQSSVSYNGKAIITSYCENTGVEHVKAKIAKPGPGGSIEFGMIEPVGTVSAAFKGIHNVYGALYKTIGDLNLILYSACFPGKVAYTTGDRSAYAMAMFLGAVGTPKSVGNVFERPVSYAFEQNRIYIETNMLSKTTHKRGGAAPSQLVNWGGNTRPPTTRNTHKVPTFMTQRIPVTNKPEIKAKVMTNVSVDDFLSAKLVKLFNLTNTENVKRKLNKIMALDDYERYGAVKYMKRLENKLKNGNFKNEMTTWLGSNTKVSTRQNPHPVLPNNGTNIRPDQKKHVELHKLQGPTVQKTQKVTIEQLKNLLNNNGIEYPAKATAAGLKQIAKNAGIQMNNTNANANANAKAKTKAPPGAKPLSMRKSKAQSVRGVSKKPVAAKKSVVAKKSNNARAVKAKAAANKVAASEAKAAGKNARNKGRAARIAARGRTTPVGAKRKLTTNVAPRTAKRARTTPVAANTPKTARNATAPTPNTAQKAATPKSATPNTAQNAARNRAARNAEIKRIEAAGPDPYARSAVIQEIAAR